MDSRRNDEAGPAFKYNTETIPAVFVMMFQQVFARYLTNAWAIFVLALLIRIGTFYYTYFIFKTPGGIAPSPNANEVYPLLALSLLKGQGLQAWYFAYRPPLLAMFMVVIYGLFNTTNPLAAVFAQMFISASICILAQHLANEMELAQPLPWLAALLTALDPASVRIGLVLLSETLRDFFVVLALIFLVRLLKKGQLRDSAACAASVVLAALARPDAIYFFVVVGLIVIIFVPRRLSRLVMFISIVGLGVMPWYVRNYIYAHHRFTFATSGDFNLLFYKAVSVEYWATGKSPLIIEAEFTYELERRLGIARSRDSYDETSMWPYLVPEDIKAYQYMNEMAWEVYVAHPLTYIALIPITIIQLLGFSDPPDFLNPATAISWIFNIAFYLSAFAGSLVAVRRKMWRWLFVLIAPTAYFLLVPTVTGGVGNTRARTSVTVCLAILAAAGLIWAWRRWHERRPLSTNSAQGLS